MTPDIVRRLRAATHEAHSELERRLDIFSHLHAPQTRAALVARFAAMHRVADSEMSDWLTPIADLHYSLRSRAAVSRSDLDEGRADVRIFRNRQPRGRCGNPLHAEVGLSG